MTQTIHKHSAGGLVIRDGAVLLIHWDEPRNSYDFPKGSIEAGESPEVACVREVLEETGFDTKIIRYVGQTHYEYDWIDGTHHDKIVDYFLLEVMSESKPQRELHETFENVWMPIHEALKILTRDIDKDILKKAIQKYEV